MKNKGEKGSVVLFITVTCIFIIFMLMILVMNLENKKQSQNKQIQQISEQYDVTEQDMEQAYLKNVNTEKPSDGYEIYSVPGAEDMIAPTEIFEYEVISEPIEGEKTIFGLSTGKAKITGLKPKYCNKGGYNSDTETFENTNYEIKYNDQTISETLVVPYEIEIEGKMYTITEVNLRAYGRNNIDGQVGVSVKTGIPVVETIILPNTIEKISEGSYFCLENNSVKNVILSNNLEEICDTAFSGYAGLTSIEIPETVTSIGTNAFLGCGLNSIYIPSSVTKLGSGVFGGCSQLYQIRCGAKGQPSEWDSEWKINCSAEVLWEQSN